MNMSPEQIAMTQRELKKWQSNFLRLAGISRFLKNNKQVTTLYIGKIK